MSKANENKEAYNAPHIQQTEKKLAVSHKSQRDKDRELVRGVFRYHEVPGGFLEFSFRKWKEDPIEYYKLDDGEICTLPYGVAKHLNTNLAYPIHSYVMDKDGKPIQSAKTMIRRCTFQSLDFIDDPELLPQGKPLTLIENI